ncbi:hypothetical protein DES49_0520 [Halospina denitrificans]|uniref:Uncharacterized protein n=1 Tax=Halospina denitrificans TaxID=332522 RepID=A0A4V3ER30_9GAMM|nr:hypothetical protein DES49_0520 [Halospina denitrificans]
MENCICGLSAGEDPTGLPLPSATFGDPSRPVYGLMSEPFRVLDDRLPMLLWHSGAMVVFDSITVAGAAPDSPLRTLRNNGSPASRFIPAYDYSRET